MVRRVNMLGEDLTLKEQMLAGPEKLFPDSDWNDAKTVDSIGKYGIKVQHMIGPFDNGYQMSVIKGPGTIGGEKGLWEIAPMDIGKHFIGQALLDWNDDVMGKLTLKQVYEQCKLLEKL